MQQHYLLDVVSRLDLQLTGFDDETDDLFEVPDARGFLDALLRVYPWLPVWLDHHDGMPAQISDLIEL